MTNDKYHCPKCSVEMNHHADKVNETISLQTEGLGADFNGVIEAAYTCPVCGAANETTLHQTKEIETANGNFAAEYKPRTSQRLRHTYSRLL